MSFYAFAGALPLKAFSIWAVHVSLQVPSGRGSVSKDDVREMFWLFCTCRGHIVEEQ